MTEILLSGIAREAWGIDRYVKGLQDHQTTMKGFSELIRKDPNQVTPDIKTWGVPKNEFLEENESVIEALTAAMVAQEVYEALNQYRLLAWAKDAGLYKPKKEAYPFTNAIGDSGLKSQARYAHDFTQFLLSTEGDIRKILQRELQNANRGLLRNIKHQAGGTATGLVYWYYLHLEMKRFRDTQGAGGLDEKGYQIALAQTGEISEEYLNSATERLLPKVETLIRQWEASHRSETR